MQRCLHVFCLAWLRCPVKLLVPGSIMRVITACSSTHHTMHSDREQKDEEESGIFHRAERVSSFRGRALRMVGPHRARRQAHNRLSGRWLTGRCALMQWWAKQLPARQPVMASTIPTIAVPAAGQCRPGAHHSKVRGRGAGAEDRQEGAAAGQAGGPHHRHCVSGAQRRRCAAAWHRVGDGQVAVGTAVPCAAVASVAQLPLAGMKHDLLIGA